MPIVVRDAKKYLLWVATKEYKYDLHKQLTDEQLLKVANDLYCKPRDPNVRTMKLILGTDKEPENSSFAVMAEAFGLTWRIDG